jgi:hypothetical protein
MGGAVAIAANVGNGTVKGVSLRMTTMRTIEVKRVGGDPAEAPRQAEVRTGAAERESSAAQSASSTRSKPDSTSFVKSWRRSGAVPPRGAEADRGHRTGTMMADPRAKGAAASFIPRATAD